MARRPGAVGNGRPSKASDTKERDQRNLTRVKRMLAKVELAPDTQSNQDIELMLTAFDLFMAVALEKGWTAADVGEFIKEAYHRAFAEPFETS